MHWVHEGHCLQLPSQRWAPSWGQATPPPSQVRHKSQGRLGRWSGRGAVGERLICALSQQKCSECLPCIANRTLCPHRAHILPPKASQMAMASTPWIQQREKLEIGCDLSRAVRSRLSWEPKAPGPGSLGGLQAYIPGPLGELPLPQAATGGACPA